MTRRGAHYHCPVNRWDCPYYKDKEIIEGTRSSVCVKSPAIPMRNVMISSLCMAKGASLMTTLIIAKRTTNRRN